MATNQKRQRVASTLWLWLSRCYASGVASGSRSRVAGAPGPLHLAGLGEADADRRGPACRRTGTHSTQTSASRRNFHRAAASAPLGTITASPFLSRLAAWDLAGDGIRLLPAALKWRLVGYAEFQFLAFSEVGVVALSRNIKSKDH